MLLALLPLLLKQPLQQICTGDVDKYFRAVLVSDVHNSHR